MDREPLKSSGWVSRLKNALSKLFGNPRKLGTSLFLGAAAIMILYVIVKPKEPKSAGSWRSKTSASRASTDPTSLDNLSTDAGDSGTGDLDKGEADPDDSGVGGSDSSSQSELQQTEKPAAGLSTASSKDLIEELLGLRKRVDKSRAVTFVSAEQCARVANRLLEMDISETEELFAISCLIEASIRLDSLNKNANLKADYVRENLIKVRDKYCDHPDAAIGSKASLGFPLVPLHNFYASKDPAELLATAEQFDLHGGKILRHSKTTAEFVKLVIQLYNDSNQSKEYEALAVRVMNRMRNIDDKTIKEQINKIGENIFFAKSDLTTLVSRIEGGNSIARRDVQRLFEGLEANPSCRVIFYEIAANVVAEYLRLGHTEDADALLKWFVSINEKNQHEANRAAIEKGIKAFREIRNSPDPSALIQAPK